MEKNRKISLITLIAITLILLLSSSLIRISPAESNDCAHKAIALTYLPHSPIQIISNIEFQYSNATTGIVWGSGTITDPYIIRGWDIYVTGPEVAAIEIQATDAYFRIENCRPICSGGYGIFLLSAINGIVCNNNCSNSAHGIDVSSGGYHIITNNTCVSNSVNGIRITSSVFNTVSNNNISNNGINAGSEQCGIFLLSSDNNIVSNNNCSYNRYMGLSVRDSDYDVVSNNTCKFNDDGMYLDDGEQVTVTNNVFSNNDYGVKLHSCMRPARYNILTGNNISENTLYAIQISNANTQKNMIWNNTFYDNNGAGDIYNPACIQASDGGTTNWWNSTNGYGNCWNDWRTPDENFDAIVDLPYNLTGGTGAKDFYPLASPPGIDMTPPVTNCAIIGSLGNNGWYVSNLIVNLNTIDAGSGVDCTNYVIDLASPITYSSPFSISSEGTFNITFWSCDKVGNNEENETIRLSIDKTAPISSAEIIDRIINITSMDNMSGVNCTYYRIDNGTWQPYSTPFNISTVDGEILEYYSIDYAGNNEVIKTISLNMSISQDGVDSGEENGIILIIGGVVAIFLSGVLLIFLIRKNRKKL
jgi:parallel beta-helix repeat protein